MFVAPRISNFSLCGGGWSGKYDERRGHSVYWKGGLNGYHDYLDKCHTKTIYMGREELLPPTPKYPIGGYR